MIQGFAMLATTFEPPTTKDFVFGCWGGSFGLFGFNFCFNFITLLLLLTSVIFVLLFYLAFRRATIMPGKFQTLMEMGIQFVREQIALPLLGEHADHYLPLLASLFFFIFIGNLFEVLPGFGLSASSRIAIPGVMAVVVWVLYNAAGIRKHGFFGYLKLSCVIADAPALLRYFPLAPIEFVSNILIRPVTLTIRLAANLLAGHFLLAVFFLGTIFFLRDGPKTWILVGVSFPFAIILVGFEIFVAVLQAFIFSILTASYIGGAISEGH